MCHLKFYFVSISFLKYGVCFGELLVNCWAADLREREGGHRGTRGDVRTPLPPCIPPISGSAFSQSDLGHDNMKTNLSDNVNVSVASAQLHPSIPDTAVGWLDNSFFFFLLSFRETEIKKIDKKQVFVLPLTHKIPIYCWRAGVPPPPYTNTHTHLPSLLIQSLYSLWIFEHL